MSNNKYYLNISGNPVEVTEELYTYFMRSEWREWYIIPKNICVTTERES